MKLFKYRQEFLRFVCVGTLNTLLGYMLYWSFLLVLPYAAAYTVSYAVGIVVSYLANCRFVFMQRPAWKGALRFPLVYVVQYGVGLGLLAAFVERFHWDKRLAAAAVACCSIPVTFILSRWIIRTGNVSRRPVM